MRKFKKLTIFFTFLIGTIAIILICVISVNAEAKLTGRSKLAIDGIRLIRVGITSVAAEFSQNRSQLLANSQLSQTQINRLKFLGTKVAVPSYVPAGFQVADIQIQPCPSGVRRFCPSYAIIYRNSNNFCFAIESTGGGIGDMPSDNLEKSYPVNNSILGKSAVLKYRKNPRLSGPTLTGGWSGQGPFYRFTGADSRLFLKTAPPELSNCSDISPQEAVRVWESLRYLP